MRELKEETNLTGENPQLIGVYGKPGMEMSKLQDSNLDSGRDPRKHVVTIFYLVDVKDLSTMKAGDDAADAKFYNANEIVQVS